MSKHRDADVDPVTLLAEPEAATASRPALEEQFYAAELYRLQVELVKLQEWIKAHRPEGGGDLRGARRGRQGRRHQAHHRARSTPASAASSPWACPPSARSTQWYFQRYVAHLPAAGEIVLFDRSWYNRAGVERVMGFCSDEEHARVPAQLPRVRAHAGALRHHARQVLVLGQRRGAGAALPRPHRATPPSAGSSAPWTSSRARAGWSTRGPRTRCSPHTDIKQAPWYVVDADDKKRARLNYTAPPAQPVPLRGPDAAADHAASRGTGQGLRAAADEDQTFVPEVY